MKTFPFHSKYANAERAAIKKLSYANGDPAWIVYDVDNNEALVTATVNMEASGIHPAPGNVIIKDYSENEGTLEALKNAGIIGGAVKTHPAGWVEVFECPIIESELK
jgi:endonuclease V-like protein UPF0215 family